MKISDILQEDTPKEGPDRGNVSAKNQDSAIELYQDLGTFIALSVDRSSSDKIMNFCEDYDIENPVPKEELHCTLIYTTDFMKGFVSEGVLEDPYMINGFELEVWKGSDGNNVLVAKFEDEAVSARHDAIVREWPDLQQSYDQFIPHITISYDSLPEKDLKLQRLTYQFNEYVDWLALNEEYVQPAKEKDDNEK